MCRAPIKSPEFGTKESTTVQAISVALAYSLVTDHLANRISKRELTCPCRSEDSFMVLSSLIYHRARISRDCHRLYRREYASRGPPSSSRRLDRSDMSSNHKASKGMHIGRREWQKNTKCHEAALSHRQKGRTLRSSDARHVAHRCNLICNRVGTNGRCQLR